MSELPVGERPLGVVHHLLDAARVAAPEADVAVEAHVPADAHDAEQLGLRDPLEVHEEPEEHEDVEQGLVVRDHDVRDVRPHVLDALTRTRQAGFSHV
jgi:hypothetical protein